MRPSNGDAGNSEAHGASPKMEDADRRTIASEVQAVRKLFTEAQRTVQCHRRCCDALLRLLSKHKSAWDEYLACLSRILVVSKRDPGVERLVQFVILLAASGGGGNEEEGGAAPGDEHGALLDRTVEFLLTRSAAADKAVRFRCCQLLGGMMTEYSQRFHVQEEEIDRVVDVLLPRLQDKVAGVRVQAVAALRPFQFALEEDEDEAVLQDDRVRAELMRAMMSDSSPDVRQAALVAVDKTVGMLDQLVLRTQDVKESVRKAAFRSLGEDVSSKNLQPQQRVTLVKMGLSDGSEAVVEACRFMICAHWFREVGYDPMELLRRLNVLGNEKVPEQVVREIVRLGLRADRERGDPSLGMGLTLEDAKALRKAAGRRVSLGSSTQGGGGEGEEGTGGEGGGAGGGGRFSPEEVLYVRIQAEVVKEEKEISAAEKETRLEAILPDTMSLCDQIELKSEELKELVEKIEAAAVAEEEEEGEGESGDLDRIAETEIFVLEQLLKLAAHADSSEEAGRRRLVNLLQALLVDTNTTHHVVESSMEALAAAHPSEADFVRIVAELVSDISDLVHSRAGGGEASVHNASLTGSVNTSFASVLGGLGDAGGAAATPNRSFSIMRSAVRAAIPKNFVKDRARAIEGIPALASDVLAEGGGGSDGKDGKEKAVVAGEATVSSEDDVFMDAVSHHSNDGSPEGVRQLAGGVGEDVEMDGREVELDIRRMFRILDILSVLLTKTRQTLAKDATLTAFEDVLLETLRWSTEVLPTLAPDLSSFGPELRKLAVQALGKYSLLGEAAAVRHRSMLLQIALCEDETVEVRICAMQALSDLSLIFRGAVFGSTGDLLSMFADTLKNRSANRAMVAVAAEAVSRLLFFGLAHDPELLGRLFVLYFEKGSAADPSAERRQMEGGGGGEGEEEEEEEDDGDGDAKEVGSSVRLSQILGVYFRSLPSAPTKVRDMLFESMRHALHVLREIAELNAAAKKNNEDEENETVELIDVPAQAVVKFVLELLMRHEEGATPSPSAVDKPSTSSSSSTTPPSSPSVRGTDDSEEGADEGVAKGQDGQQVDLESNGQEKSASTEDGVDTDKAATDASAHAALCLTEELWTLTGIDGLSDLVLALAKVLASLPLPQDDQTAVKRLRYNVDRMEALGDGRLGTKVSKIIAKYAEVLLAADLTPNEGIGLGDDSDEDNDDEHDSAADERDADGGVEKEEGKLERGEEATEQVPTRKKKRSTRTSSPTTAIEQEPPLPSRRPARKSKVEARARIADAEAKAAAAAAIDEASSSDSSSSSDEEEEEEEGDADATAENGTGKNGGDANSNSESDDSTATVVKATPARAKAKGKATPRRSPRRRSSRVIPLSEISNSSPMATN